MCVKVIHSQVYYTHGSAIWYIGNSTISADERLEAKCVMFDLISVKYSEDVGIFSVIKRKWLGIVYEDDECIEVEKL